jgi:dethiobiotin synthase
MSLFVTGTDTGIGKTLVSTLLCLKQGWKYWKPIQSGLDGPTDSEIVAEHIGEANIQAETYLLPEPLSPHLSAKRAELKIDLHRVLRQKRTDEPTVIEGAGGILVPLNDEILLLDLIERIQVPVLLVASSKLGTINHTLLSLAALRSRKIEPVGVVMVGNLNSDNREAIEHFGKTRVLGEIPILNSITIETLKQASELIDLKGPRYERRLHTQANTHQDCAPA